MSKPGRSRNLAASVRQRLLDLAHANGEDFQQLLVRYALERLLYRLSCSVHRERFVLKGALLFRLWFNLEHRPTRDADFLGMGDAEPQALLAVFRELIAVEDLADGLEFLGDTLQALPIRKDAGYPGVRISLFATLDRARIPVQCDIAFGDAVTTAPEQRRYPTVLDMPAPLLPVYPPETVIAEKLEALVKLGRFNTRLKDYFDLWLLMRFEAIDREMLPQAVAATFARRSTPLPAELPAGFTETFAADRAAMWRAFLDRSALQAPELLEVVVELRAVCWPLLQAAAQVKR